RDVYGGAIPWLALHETGFTGLAAGGLGFETAPVPELFLRPGEFRATVGLIDGGGACFLTRPPEAPDGAPFVLGVRGVGASGALVERRVGTIRSWDAAGRPATSGARVRAYPIEVSPPSDGAVIVAKRWHHYLLDWPGARARCDCSYDQGLIVV